MKINLLKSILVSVFMFAFAALTPTVASAAPRLYFNPSSATSSYNNDFVVDIMIDTDTSSAFGADAVINFPIADMTLKSVSNGGFFSDFSYAPSDNTIEIHGFFSAAFQTKSGSGVFAKLTFTPQKGSGAGSLTFTCDGSGNDTEIINGTGTNVLSCSSLNTLGVNYGGSSSGGNSGTGGTISTPGPTNACGGTCGSHYNCNAGLFCSNGFCRNPDCPSSNSCGCTEVTATPRAAARPRVATPKPSVKPTPQLIVLKKYTPAPLNLPTDRPQEAGSDAKKIDLKKIALWGGIIALLAIIIAAIAKAIKKHKGKNLPPNIPMTPPMMTPPPFKSPPESGPGN